MEPGGDDHPELYTAWEAAGAGRLIDAAEQRGGWNLRVPARLQMHHFASKPTSKKARGNRSSISCWILREDADAHAISEIGFGRIDGDMALIDCARSPPKNLAGAERSRSIHAEPSHFIRRRLAQQTPWKSPFSMARPIGTSTNWSREASFDADGLRWRGATLCALITHPSRPTRTYAFWREYGEMLRGRYDAGSATRARKSG